MAVNYKIVSLACLSLVVIALLLLDVEGSLLGSLFANYAEPDWNAIPERYIVKSSVPIHPVDGGDTTCQVTAERFSTILDHRYFSRSQQLAQELKFDGNMTLTIPCDSLPDGDPKIHIWYVTEESPSHPGKYRYFITGD